MMFFPLIIVCCICCPFKTIDLSNQIFHLHLIIRTHYKPLYWRCWSPIRVFALSIVA